ncbi:MAG: hypothetical protein H6Q14_214 [Bacteroidetes bacterium]|nr:hypothetical protein [Bacteroidota bacterium]
MIVYIKFEISIYNINFLYILDYNFIYIKIDI